MVPVPKQETNWRTVYTLSHLLTDTLDTGLVDYLTPDNTFVTDVHQLSPLAIPGGRRRLLAAPPLGAAAAVPSPAASSDPWPPSHLPPAPLASAAPAPQPGTAAPAPSMLNDLGPIPGLAVSYEVANVLQPVRSLGSS
jgi:hypothetical protein